MKPGPLKNVRKYVGENQWEEHLWSKFEIFAKNLEKYQKNIVLQIFLRFFFIKCSNLRKIFRLFHEFIHLNGLRCRGQRGESMTLKDQFLPL